MNCSDMVLHMNTIQWYSSCSNYIHIHTKMQFYVLIHLVSDQPSSWELDYLSTIVIRTYG